MAETLVRLARMGRGGTDSWQTARTAAQTALQAGDSIAAAHLALGNVEFWHDWLRLNSSESCEQFIEQPVGLSGVRGIERQIFEGEDRNPRRIFERTPQPIGASRQTNQSPKRQRGGPPADQCRRSRPFEAALENRRRRCLTTIHGREETVPLPRKSLDETRALCVVIQHRPDLRDRHVQ